MNIVHTIEDLRRTVDGWRAKGETLALVPTMGALHAGHLSLVDVARHHGDRVIATLFVNPKQFGADEDLATYPRDKDGDAAKLTNAGVDLLYAPSVDVMYPEGDAMTVSVPGLGDILEGEHRPGFFTGVATVVAKLLTQVTPDVAVFGEKDYQQLLVIKRMVADLGLPVRIVSGKTVREADGLALSSRNAYLSKSERAIAPSLHRALMDVATARATESQATEALLAAGFASVDYLTLRDSETLAPVDASHTGPKRVLAAARLGTTRLIDNAAV